VAGRIYVLSGPPGCGKSLLIAAAQKESFLPTHIMLEVVTKHTTRRKREEEGSEIKPVEYNGSIRIPKCANLLNFVEAHKKYYSWDPEKDQLILDGPMLFEERLELLGMPDLSENIKQEIERLYNESNTLPQECDIIYEQYRRRYGLVTNDIIVLLQRSSSAILIINDIRAIKELIALFGPLVIAIFIYRTSVDMFALQKSRGAYGANGKVDMEQIMLRQKKSEIILRRYFDNIELFDHVIINNTNNKSHPVAQLYSIITYYSNANEILYKISGGLN
jgi:guanylate kinase